jgi:hypothetical protein
MIESYIKSNTVERKTCLGEEASDWGQMSLETVRALVSVGIPLGFNFSFSKIYEGPNDDYEPVVITALGDNLFVYPEYPGDDREEAMAGFWGAVDAYKNNQKQIISDICADVVDEWNNTRKGNRRNNRVGLISLAGKAKHTRIISDWLATFTSGMTISEACAVISTNPAIVKKLEDVRDTVRLNICEKSLFNLEGERRSTTGDRRKK